MKPKHSLLEDQLRALGFQDGDVDPIWNEKERQDSIELPELNLGQSVGSHNVVAFEKSRKSSTVYSQYAVFLAMAAAALFIIFTGESWNEGLRVKGVTKVWLYWERDGVASQWTPDTELRSGDRVRAEVMVVDDVYGYLAVTDRNGMLLSDPKSVFASEIFVQAGSKKVFQGSLELVGASEGETVTVIVCRSPLAKEIIELSMARMGEPFALNVLPESCAVETFVLRE